MTVLQYPIGHGEPCDVCKGTREWFPGMPCMLCGENGARRNVAKVVAEFNKRKADKEYRMAAGLPISDVELLECAALICRSYNSIRDNINAIDITPTDRDRLVAVLDKASVFADYVHSEVARRIDPPKAT